MTHLWLLPSCDQPRVIGHRGASAHAPENTLTAFRLAIAQGAAGVELDVWQCRSGEVVVIHDEDVSRTTNGRGKVREMDWSELSALQIGEGERIPLLREVLLLVDAQAPPILVNIELKQLGRTARSLVQAVAGLLGEGLCRDRVLISSFSPLALMWATRLLPDVPRAVLYAPSAPRWLRWVQQWVVPHQVEHPHVSCLTPGFVRALHQRGMRVNTWTVNTRAEAGRAAACGVDGVIGDSPALLYAWLRQP